MVYQYQVFMMITDSSSHVLLNNFKSFYCSSIISIMHHHTGNHKHATMKIESKRIKIAVW